MLGWEGRITQQSKNQVDGKAKKETGSLVKNTFGVTEDRATQLELQVCGCAMVGKAVKANGT